MSFGGYDAFDDPYCYPGTAVLQNLLNIRDPYQQSAFELEISTLRAEEPLPQGSFDTSHYSAVHHHLFQDVYTWAGQYRTVRTSKGDNSFCYPEFIPGEMQRLFAQLRKGAALADLSDDGFLNIVTPFLGELNAIHPFREGNGRAQLSFLGLLGATYRHPFDFTRLNAQTFLAAMIASFTRKLQPLREELKCLLA